MAIFKAPKYQYLHMVGGGPVIDFALKPRSGKLHSVVRNSQKSGPGVGQQVLGIVFETQSKSVVRKQGLGQN